MNLAAIFSIILWVASAWAPVAAPEVTQEAQQPAQQPSQPPEKTTSPAQSSPAQSSPPAQSSTANPQPSSAPQSSSGQAAKPKSNHKHKKKVADTTICNSAGAATTGPASTETDAAKNSSPANCPPAKTVVKNGGTSEPAIQLTGEGATQAQQRSTTDQLLGSTQDNLKKIAGRQLTASEQEMVTQIRQYMQQSKEAVTAGDAERGRMLAQKARLLSDELVKP